MSATAEATKYGRLWMASIMSLGALVPARARICGPETRIFATSSGGTLRLAGGSDGRFHRGLERMGAGDQLDRQVLVDFPLVAELAGQAFGVCLAAAEDGQKAARRLPACPG